MQSVPAEIFDNIFGYITEARDLQNLRAVSRYFDQRFTPSIFRMMGFKNSAPSALRFAHMAQSRIAEYVQDMTIDLDTVHLPGGATGM